MPERAKKIADRASPVGNFLEANRKKGTTKQRAAAGLGSAHQRVAGFPHIKHGAGVFSVACCVRFCAAMAVTVAAKQYRETVVFPYLCLLFAGPAGTVAVRKPGVLPQKVQGAIPQMRYADAYSSADLRVLFLQIQKLGLTLSKHMLTATNIGAFCR